MALYEKQLHIRKGDEIENINLYTSLDDCGDNVLYLRDGDKVLYVDLGLIGSGRASSLRIPLSPENTIDKHQAYLLYILILAQRNSLL